MDPNSNGKANESGGPKAYEPPKLTYVGKVVDIVQSGGGKLSVDAPDGPDTRKPPGK
jgi:hypothetical protein